MTIKQTLMLSAAAVVVAALFVGAPSQPNAQTPAVAIDNDDIGGVVTGPKGPEAGVWVIAETTDLPTKYAKIVVTDDQGRYVLPDLPKAKYKVWVRGYGLVDSAKVDAEPGRALNLTAVVAPNEKAAAEYYPPIYWYSMLRIPAKSEFPGTGPQGNGINPGQRNQHYWIADVKSLGCMSCHALGTPGTRAIPHEFGKDFANSRDAWMRRLQAGQAMGQMVGVTTRLGPDRAVAEWANWTDRVAAGETPKAKPTRPQGVERNVVLTLWDWGDQKTYLHDLIATDRRKPTVNAGGKIYGTQEHSSDLVPVLDPVTHTASNIKHPVLDPKTPSTRELNAMTPSAYWGEEPIWTAQADNHNPMMDEQGRLWFTVRVRPPANNPGFCRQGSDHPSAKVYPLNSSTRQTSMYDPASGKFTLIDLCYPTHHLIFAEDADNTLWFSSGVGGLNVAGWLNRRVFEQTGDHMKAQGWSPFVLDTNGNGRRDDGWVQPNQPVDPQKDKRVAVNFYSVVVNPQDGSVWGQALSPFPSFVVRFDPKTQLSEIYSPPLPGYGGRGGDIDRNGVFWTSLASGHLGEFDRRKCKVLNGPTATGDHCPEGWKLHRMPGPTFESGVDAEHSVEASYYTWVDWFNVSGLGENVPIATGNMNSSLLALVGGKWVNLVVPYPMGFFTKWVEGRIDDASAGWKGRGLWTTYSNRTMFHLEGGKENRPKVVKFQMRPDPLAK
jgi:hypothetical protein